MRFGSHCSWHRTGPFLTHIRGRTGKRCQPATPISLPRRHFWLRCGCLPSPDHFFPAGASLRPSVSEATNECAKRMHAPSSRSSGSGPTHHPSPPRAHDQPSRPKAPEAWLSRCRSLGPEACRPSSELTSHPVTVHGSGIGHFALADDSSTAAARRPPVGPLPLETGPHPVFRTILNHSEQKIYRQKPRQGKFSFPNLRGGSPPVTLRLCLQSQPSNAAAACAPITRGGAGTESATIAAP